jgi:DNA-binding transcriptional LysR family regulator
LDQTLVVHGDEEVYVFPGVELRLHRYVVAIAEELNFTRAADRVHVAQSALSRQIQHLENDLGFALFERDHRGVRLTVAGEAFAAESRLALFHAQRAVEAARAARGQHRGPWTLGYSPLIDLRMLARIQQNLSQAHPRTEVRLASAHTSEQADGLIRGRLQAGLVILPLRQHGLTTEGFYRQALLLALPELHPLAKKPAVEVGDLNELPLITIRSDIEPRFGEDLRRIFETAHVRPSILREATTQAEVLELVSEGSIAALTMPSAQHPPRDRVVFRDFVDGFLTAEIGLAHLAESESAILASLRKFLWDTFQPLGRTGFRDGRARQMALF